jgi:hypothetical protein
MAGYIRGFVEKKHESWDDWEFVCRVDPLVGSQGDFKYLLLAKDKFSLFEPFPYSEGFPEDMSIDTKAHVAGVESEDVEEAFREYVDSGSTPTYLRSMSLSELLEFDWDEGIEDKELDELREEVQEKYPNNFDSEKLDIFKLQNYGKKKIWYYDDSFSIEEIKSLVDGDKIEKKGKKLYLERKTRREILPESWFRLLDLMEFFKDHGENVRFIFYWHH